MKDLNLLKASASELQGQLQSGYLSSIQLVKACLKQISKYNHEEPVLRAIYAVPPEDKVLAVAEQLDKKRVEGRVRGLLHGVPLIVKDTINTGKELGMGTTLGSYAFENSWPRQNAVVIDRVRAISGHTPHDVLMGDNITSGWSALGGQAQSAYVPGGVKPREMRLGHSAPGGSSSGSAVGVSAGFSPLSIGTEADGSLATPASRSALFGMKPTVGSTAMQGVFVISRAFDTLGGMAKSVQDLSYLIEYIQDDSAKSGLPDMSWAPLRLGFVKPEDWFLPASLVKPDAGAETQMKTAIGAAISKIGALGAEIVGPVGLPHPGSAGIWKNMGPMFDYEATGVIDSYLTTRDGPEMKTIQDIVDFNLQHADLELPEDYPNQNLLLGPIQRNVTESDYLEAKAMLRRVAYEEGMLKVMNEHQLDAILGPSDGPLASVAAATGAPVATMPLGVLDLNGRPFGLSVITKPGQDGMIFHVLSAFEATFPGRILPPLLVASETASNM
ncbi:amidase signature enzyme [Cadophora sp. DSE1049]|nr:amidase signature enzyme [Cadophora sp. DSE1049]